MLDCTMSEAGLVVVELTVVNTLVGKSLSRVDRGLQLGSVILSRFTTHSIVTTSEIEFSFLSFLFSKTTKVAR